MSDMIERVARALCIATGELPDTETPYHPTVSHIWEHYIPDARAAIEAMREPTETMYCAGDEEILAHLNSEKFIKGEDTPAVDCWKAMIDAALAEEKTG